ncbi:hypothetical protein BKA65DRAFT_507065 [Rhexocercosporidium sp. MPI-PUGE-AT-0058]|nr:hypothetical protein BKA65DRAFT_507065 [Rhexocercosporidium sp. MPI-PUGE-AT-0058]
MQILTLSTMLIEILMGLLYQSPQVPFIFGFHSPCPIMLYLPLCSWRWVGDECGRTREVPVEDDGLGEFVHALICWKGVCFGDES